MIKGKIDTNNYGLIQEYRPFLGRWLYTAYAIPLLIGAGALLFFYEKLHRVVNPDYPQIFEVVANPVILIGILVLVVFITYSAGRGSVMIFQEGVYVDPGAGGYRDPARRMTFLPWDELRMIVRTPYGSGGMSLVGEGPLDEVILPGRLSKRFNEIQDDILHMCPSGRIRVIDLRDIANSPLGEYGAPIQGLWGLAPAAPVIVGLAKAFRDDIMIATTYSAGWSNSANSSIVLLPVMTGALLLAVLVFIGLGLRSGRFSYRLAVYKDGLLTHAMGMASFARWEEIQSIEKVKRGQYKLNPVDERVKPVGINIGKSNADDFERVMKRLGKFVG